MGRRLWFWQGKMVTNLLNRQEIAKRPWLWQGKSTCWSSDLNVWYLALTKVTFIFFLVNNDDIRGSCFPKRIGYGSCSLFFFFNGEWCLRTPANFIGSSYVQVVSSILSIGVGVLCSLSDTPVEVLRCSYS